MRHSLSRRVRDPHARGHLRLVHVQARDALDTDSIETSTTRDGQALLAGEPRLLVDTEERARGTIPGFRGRLPRQTVCGLTGTKILTTTDEQTRTGSTAPVRRSRP